MAAAWQQAREDEAAEREAKERIKNLSPLELWIKMADKVHPSRPYYAKLLEMGTGSEYLRAKNLKLYRRELQLMAASFQNALMPHLYRARLRFLDMSSCGITAPNCDALAAGLSENTSFETIILRNNPLGADGVEQIMKALSHSLRLQQAMANAAVRLTVERHEAAAAAGRPAGSARSARSSASTKAPPVTGTLKVLDLAQTDMTVPRHASASAQARLLRHGVRACAAYLANPYCGLRELDMSKNRFNSMLMDPLVKSLRRNTSLKELRIDHSAMPTASAVAILDLATRNVPPGYQPGNKDHHVSVSARLGLPSVQDFARNLRAGASEAAAGSATAGAGAPDTADSRPGTSGTMLSVTTGRSWAPSDMLRRGALRTSRSTVITFMDPASWGADAATLGSLESLSLRGAAIGDDGAEHITPYLRRHGSALKKLNLSSCKLTAVGMRRLCLGLRVSPIRSVDLSRNQVGVQGAFVLADMISSRHVLLRELRVARCKLTDDGRRPDGALAIAHALRDNRTLEVLDLSANCLCPQKMQFVPPALSQAVPYALADSLGENRSLMRLDVSNNWIGVPGKEALKKAIAKYPMAVRYASTIKETLEAWLKGGLWIRAQNRGLALKSAHPMVSRTQALELVDQHRKTMGRWLAHRPATAPKEPALLPLPGGPLAAPIDTGHDGANVEAAERRRSVVARAVTYVAHGIHAGADGEAMRAAIQDLHAEEEGQEGGSGASPADALGLGGLGATSPAQGQALEFGEGGIEQAPPSPSEASAGVAPGRPPRTPQRRSAAAGSAQPTPETGSAPNSALASPDDDQLGGGPRFGVPALQLQLAGTSRQSMRRREGRHPLPGGLTGSPAMDEAEAAGLPEQIKRVPSGDAIFGERAPMSVQEALAFAAAGAAAYGPAPAAEKGPAGAAASSVHDAAAPASAGLVAAAAADQPQVGSLAPPLTAGAPDLAGTAASPAPPQGLLAFDQGRPVPIPTTAHSSAGSHGDVHGLSGGAGPGPRTAEPQLLPQIDLGHGAGAAASEAYRLGGFTNEVAAAFQRQPIDGHLPYGNEAATAYAEVAMQEDVLGATAHDDLPGAALEAGGLPGQPLQPSVPLAEQAALPSEAQRVEDARQAALQLMRADPAYGGPRQRRRGAPATEGTPLDPAAVEHLPRALSHAQAEALIGRGTQSRGTVGRVAADALPDDFLAMEGQAFFSSNNTWIRDPLRWGDNPASDLDLAKIESVYPSRVSVVREGWQNQAPGYSLASQQWLVPRVVRAVFEYLGEGRTLACEDELPVLPMNARRKTKKMDVFALMLKSGLM